MKQICVIRLKIPDTFDFTSVAILNDFEINPNNNEDESESIVSTQANCSQIISTKVISSQEVKPSSSQVKRKRGPNKNGTKSSRAAASLAEIHEENELNNIKTTKISKKLN